MPKETITIDPNSEILSTGAEAIIYAKSKTVIKHRVSKSYRIEELDKNIRKTRTKKEAKLMRRIKEEVIADTHIFDIPKVIRYDSTSIEMEMIVGSETLKEVINKNNTSSKNNINNNYFGQTGEMISLLHKHNIIHGDLTTMNILVTDEKLYLIDFGLSYISHKVEDKMTDLYTYIKAVECVHSEEYVKDIYKGYELNEEEEKKLDEIKRRGRKK